MVKDKHGSKKKMCWRLRPVSAQLGWNARQPSQRFLSLPLSWQHLKCHESGKIAAVSKPMMPKTWANLAAVPPAAEAPLLRHRPRVAFGLCGRNRKILGACHRPAHRVLSHAPMLSATFQSIRLYGWPATLDHASTLTARWVTSHGLQSMVTLIHCQRLQSHETLRTVLTAAAPSPSPAAAMPALPQSHLRCQPP